MDRIAPTPPAQEIGKLCSVNEPSLSTGVASLGSFPIGQVRVSFDGQRPAYCRKQADGFYSPYPA